VGIHADFFALGGHSLKAAQLVARLRRHLHRDVTLSALFQSPTIAGLAALLDQRDGPVASSEPADAELPGRVSGIVAKAGERRRFPASSAQQRLWFLRQLGQDPEVYNMACTIRLQGPLQVEALRQAWQALVTRQESLRTRFADQDGQLAQWIDPAP